MENPLNNNQNPPLPSEKPKRKLLIMVALIVVIVAIALILLFTLLNKGGGALKEDIATKSKAFVETYGNYSYLNPDRNLSSIKKLMTDPFYKSITGGDTDYIYTANLRKTKFSMETKIVGPENVSRSGSIYTVTIPVNEKSTLNGITQNENKTYSISWKENNKEWQISDFSTKN